MMRLTESVLLLAVVACNRTTSRPSVVVTDSAGIRIVESVRPEWGDEPRWTIDPVPMLTIGTEAGEEPHQLYRVQGAHRLANRSIVVANGGTGELRFFDSTGKFLRSVGRHGGGPGEFSEVSSMYFWVLPDQRLAVSDQFNDRINVFTENGDYETLIRLAKPAATPQAWLVGVFTDGSLLVRGLVGGGILQGPPGSVIENMVTFQRYALTGQHLADLVQVASRPRYVHESGGRTGFPYVPFSQTAIATIQGDGILIVSGDAASLMHYDSTGRVDGSIRWGADERHRTEDVWSRYVEMVLDGIEDQQRRRWYQSYYQEDLPLPEYVPLADELVIDSQDYIWVRRVRLGWEKQPLWDVLSPGGGNGWGD